MLQIYFAPRSGPVWSAMWSDNTRSEPTLTSAATSNHIWLCGSVLHRTTFRSVACSAVEWVGSSKSCNKYRKQLWGGCFEKHRIIWVDLLQYASLAHNAISVHSPIFIGAQLPHTVQNWPGCKIENSLLAKELRAHTGHCMAEQLRYWHQEGKGGSTACRLRWSF